MNEEMLNSIYNQLYKDKVDYDTYKKDMSTNLDMVDYTYDKLGLSQKGVLKTRFYSDLGLTPTRQRGTLNDYMFTLESKNLGGYKAYNPRGGGQGAVGGYQHRYDTHKDAIAQVTGVTNRDEYYNNPFAQEQFQNHLVETQYKPHLNTLRKIARNKGLDYNDTELMYIEHHEGYEGAKTFLLSGNSKFGSESTIAKQIKNGRDYFKQTGTNDQIIQSSIGNSTPKEQIIKTLDQKVEKIYKDKSKQASLYMWGADTKEGVRKKVYEEAFANGELNPNDFTEKDFTELFGEKDYVSNRKRLAEKAKNNLDRQLKDQGLFEGLGDLAARYNPILAKKGTLDTKNGKINIGLGTSLPGGNTFSMYFTPEQIMKLESHPLGGNDPNSRENLHLRNIQSIIAESDNLNKLADSNGLEHKLKATVDYKNNLKNKIINKGYKTQFKEFEKLLQSEDQSEESKQKLQGLYQELSALPEFEQYYKSIEELGKMKSQFDALDNKYVRAKAYNVLENSRHIKNDKYRRSLSNSATIIKNFEDVFFNTGKKLVDMPFDLAKFGGNLVEGIAQGKLGSNVTDQLIRESEREVTEIKTSKEEDGILTNKVKFEKDGKTFYGKVNDKGEVEEIYDADGYKVNFLLDSSRQNAINLAKKQYDKYGSELEFNWTALGSGVKDTAPDLINMFLAGGFIRTGASALASGTSRLARLAKIATTPRILEASSVIPVFAAQTAKSNIRDGKLATPGEIAISTSKDLALEAISESIFEGPIGKLLGDKVTKETFLNITKSRTKDLVDNLITGKLSKIQFAKEFGKSFKELLVDMGGEGIEETFTDIAKPLTDDLLNGLLDTSFDTELPSLEELGSTFLVGAAAGGLMGGVNFAGNVSNIKTNVQEYYKDLLKSSIANVNNGKVAVASAENPLLFSKYVDQLVTDGEYSKENGDVLKSSMEYAHEQSKHLFNENPEIELSNDVKSLYTTSAFNTSYFEAIANRKKLIDEEQTAISDIKAQEYSELSKFNGRIKSELDVNIGNKINSPVTPTHVLNKIGLKLSDEELKTLEDKHKSIAKELSTNKGTDQQKSALLSNKLLQGIKDIVNSRKKEDPKKEEDASKIPDNLKENEAEIKNDIKTEVKTPDQKVDERVENPEQFDEQDEIKKELLNTLQEDLSKVENDDDYDVLRSDPLYKGKEYQDIITKHQQGKKLDAGLTPPPISTSTTPQETKPSGEQVPNELVDTSNIPLPVDKAEFDSLPNQSFDPAIQKQLSEEINTSGYNQEELVQLAKDREEIQKELNDIPLPEEDPTISAELKEKRRKEAKEREELRKQQLEVFNEREANRVASPTTSVLTSEVENNIKGITPGYVTGQKYKLQFVYKDGTTSTIDIDREVVEKSIGDKSIINFNYIKTLANPKKEIDYYHIIPNGSEKNLKSKEAQVVISKLEPGDTVYYEVDVNDSYNLESAGKGELTADNFVIDVVVYVDKDNNPIPKSSNSKKVYIAKIPANKDTDLNIKNLRDNAWRVFQDVIKNDPASDIVEIGTSIVDKTHSIPNVRYSQGFTTNSRRNVLSSEINNPDLYIVGLNHDEQAQPVVESNGRTRLANAILLNQDGSIIPNFPVPYSWLGNLIGKVGNKFIKFDTKKVSEVQSLREKLYKLLELIQYTVETKDSFNPYEDYKDYWTSLIGLNPKDTDAAVFRYRSNISNIDAENKQGKVINPRGGIAPLIFYTKGKGFTIDDGALKKEYLSLAQVYDILSDRKIHIDAKKLSKDNYNSREASQYRREIQDYLTTNYKEPTETEPHFINQTVILNPNTQFVKTKDPVSSAAVPIQQEKPKPARKSRFKISNNQSLEPLKNPTLNDNIMWFKERFKEVGISVDDKALEVIARIQNVGDRKLWGAFHNAAVILSSDANSKVTRHEAFHVLFNLFLTDDQRAQVLDEAFEKFGKELGISKEEYEKAWLNKNNTDRFSLDTPISQERSKDISDLFDTNPELANAVYESLGFKNLKNDLGTPEISDVEDGKLYQFKTKEGLIGGVLISPTEFRIDGISAYEVGKGQGTKLFEGLITYLSSNGITTLSTISAGEGAIKMHNKAVEKGLLTKVKEDGRTATFEINPQITLEQKEQAIRVYNEYLNTIFPDSKVKDIVYHGTTAIFEKFNTRPDKTSGSRYSNEAAFFTTDIELANKYGKDAGGRTIYSLLNLTNPKTYRKKEEGLDLSKPRSFTEEVRTKLQQEGFDGAVNTRYDGEYAVFEPEQIHILGSNQDIEGFREFVKKPNNVLFKLADNEVNYVLKAVDILQSNEGKKIFDKGIKNNWSLDKILTELQIPKEQKQLILDSNLTDREDIITDLLANYSYTVEINTAGEKVSALNNNYDNFNIENDNYQIQFFQNDWELGVEKYLKNNKEISQDEYSKAQSKYEELKGEQFKPTQHYSNLTVPGGINYTENAHIIPELKGKVLPDIYAHHDQEFAQGNLDMYGWDRSDDRKYTEKDIDSPIDILKKSGQLEINNEDSENISKIFKKYPELALLFNNDKYLYNRYLKSIFPNASNEFKGKLFFHGTKNPIEGGKFKISDKSLAKGLWFTKQLSYAKNMERFSSAEDNPITYGVLLDIKNPKHFKNSSGSILVQTPSKFREEYDEKNNDAAVFHHPESSDGKFTNEGGYNQIVVFDENQVHIIGDSNDISLAKQFINKNKNINVSTKTRRILEVQSKFQKWRLNFEHKNNKYQILENQPTDKPNVFEDHYLENGKRITSKEYNKIFEEFLDTPTSKEDAFIKLIAKQWETMMIKSIIQDTAKQTVTEVQESDVEAKVKELEKEGLLEIDCKGKLKAEKGLQTNFTKGGKWKLIKDLKGYPTHKEGGVDLTIGKNGVSIKNGNTEFTAKHGLVIPKN